MNQKAKKRRIIEKKTLDRWIRVCVCIPLVLISIVLVYLATRGHIDGFIDKIYYYPWLAFYVIPSAIMIVFFLLSMIVTKNEWFTPLFWISLAFTCFMIFASGVFLVFVY